MSSVYGLILKDRSIVHFCEWRVGQKLVIFCGRHNCMIADVKKITFLALVSVLHGKRDPHFLLYVLSK